MANRFELMIPDVGRAFQQGRAEVRQADRERFADQQLREQVERGNQFRQLSGQAYGAPSAQREQFVSQAASLDPQGAAALGQNLGQSEDRKMQRLGVWARALTAAPEQMKPLLYQQMLPEMRSFGIQNAPEQYSPEVGQMAQAFMEKSVGQTPASLQHFQAMTQGMRPEDIERARRVELGLEGRASSGGFGFRTVMLPDGRETLVVTDPRTGGVRQATAQEVQAFMGSGGAMGGGAAPPAPGQPPAPGGAPSGPAFVSPTPGQIEADKARGKAGVELATAPEIARQTQAAGATGKTGAERQAVFIDEGLRASDSMPVINRAIELLDAVPTGGLDAAKLAATNFLGVTGADEGELSNNLGKAVLSQLRATFGAQFTEREGARLQEIESGFGKSTAVNKRLLQQTKAIVERAARRGVDAARAAGDEFTAQQIENSLRMKLSQGRGAPGVQPGQAPAQQTAEVTATGPNGQKLVLRNGAWQPMQ